jgi:hypothetical protein
VSSSLYVNVDLGISTVFTTSATQVRGQSTTTLGKFITAYDLNNEIYLKSRPCNNMINVKIMDNSTGVVNNGTKYEYVLQLFFERVT